MELQWTACVHKLVSAGASPVLVARTQNGKPESPLHLAVRQGDAETVKLMLAVVKGGPDTLDVLSGEGGFNSMATRTDAVTPLFECAPLVVHLELPRVCNIFQIQHWAAVSLALYGLPLP